MGGDGKCSRARAIGLHLGAIATTTKTPQRNLVTKTCFDGRATKKCDIAIFGFIPQTRSVGIRNRTRKKKLNPELSRLYWNFNTSKLLQLFQLSHGSTIASAIERAFNRSLKANQLDSETLGLNFNTLWKGASKELGLKTDLSDTQNPRLALGSAMRHNIMSFVAFKNYHNVNELVAALTNRDGTARTFEQFKKAAIEIQTDFNERYLKAEFQMCQSAGQAALQWEQQWRDRDVLPKLQYRTAGDGRVRASHRILEGTCLPITDGFWQSFYPPNGHGCRCVAKQVSDAVPDRKPSRPIKDTEIPAAFRINPGVTGEITTQKHPYFQNMNELERQKVILAANQFMFNRYDNNQYSKTWFENGGYAAINHHCKDTILKDAATRIAQTGICVEVMSDEILVTNGEVRQFIIADDTIDANVVSEALRKQPKLLVFNVASNRSYIEKLLSDTIKGSRSEKGIYKRSVWALFDGELKQF